MKLLTKELVNYMSPMVAVNLGVNFTTCSFSSHLSSVAMGMMYSPYTGMLMSSVCLSIT